MVIAMPIMLEKRYGYKTISVSAGIARALVESLYIAAKQLDILQRESRQRSDPMYDVRASFFRSLARELERVLEQDRQHRPVCANYEEGQEWHTASIDNGDGR